MSNPTELLLSELIGFTIRDRPLLHGLLHAMTGQSTKVVMSSPDEAARGKRLVHSWCRQFGIPFPTRLTITYPHGLRGATPKMTIIDSPEEV